MNITVISGSTRAGRVSHRIALALENALKSSGDDVHVLDLNEMDLPVFEERYDALIEKPAAWTEVMETLVASDGLIFVTPEYNGSLTPALKNFIDIFSKRGFKGKPIGVATGTSGPMGGIRAAYQLQQIILALFAYPMPHMLTVGLMEAMIDENGNSQNPEFDKKLNLFTSQYQDFAGKISGKKTALV